MKIKKYKELILLIFLSLIINFSTINTYPVLDRDEARYAQSTKQMLETGNYKSIKFQEELRSKKEIFNEKRRIHKEMEDELIMQVL